MELFTYKAKAPDGKIQSGQVEARNIQQAAAVLRERELTVVKLKPIRRRVQVSSLPKLFSRVKFQDVANFTRQLSTMINAGLPLTDSLALLESQVPGPLQPVVTEVLKDVEGGKPLGDTFEKHPKVFNTVYVSLVRAGEAAGKLDEMLLRLADNLEKEREFKAKTRGAMIYPIIVVIGMLIVSAIMMIFVIPQMTEIYEDFGAELPFTTQLLVQISKSAAKYWHIGILGIIGSGWGLKTWSASPLGKKSWHRFMFRIPIYGDLKKEILLTEFCRTLGLLVGAGVSIVEGLTIVAETMENEIYKESIEEAAKRVEKGVSVAVTVGSYTHFPSILAQMLAVGEETGKVDEVLLKLSAYFETESEHLIKNLTTAIEPLIMIVLGVGVGFLVVSIIMPIYSLTSQL